MHSSRLPLSHQPVRISISRHAQRAKQRPRPTMLLDASHLIVAAVALLCWLALMLWLNFAVDRSDAAAACLGQSYRDPVTGRTATRSEARIDAEGKVVCGDLTFSRP